MHNDAKTTVRSPAVAGMFYPDNPRELATEVDRYLGQAGPDAGRASPSSHPPTPAKTPSAPLGFGPGDSGSSSPAPKALIAPHAGYVYSGPIAGSAFRRWRGAAHIRNVVILGPSHYTSFPGLALSGATHWATPLGLVPVNLELTEKIAALKSVRCYEPAHTQEHALEVELAFLQRILKDFTIVPLVVCDATTDEVSEVVECLWGGDETAFDISSDLSHYLDYFSARKRDRATADAIEALDADRIHPHDACGRLPIQGWLQVAAQRRFQCHTADLRNSGDTAGDKKRVVGYGAFAFNQTAPANA